jgi:hypothetical protein
MFKNIYCAMTNHHNIRSNINLTEMCTDYYKVEVHIIYKSVPETAFILHRFLPGKLTFHVSV